MTHPLAALIAGVPRHYDGNAERVMLEADVLAALEAATSPDLVEAGKVEANLRDEKTIATRTEAADTIRALIALATAQAAQIAGLTKDRNAGAADYCDLMERHDELHNALAAERAEVERLRGALDQIAWSNDSKWQADCARAALEGKA